MNRNDGRRLLEVLKVQVEGSWKDITGKERIDWTSWNVDAVEKFLELLYTGDYRRPYPTETRVVEDIAGGKTGEEACGEDQSEWVESDNDEAVVKIDDQVPKTLPTGPLTPLKDLHWDECRALGKPLSQAEEFDKWTGHKLWASHQLDYEATFATHSDLYVMACQYMLSELKNMAWQRLRADLIGLVNEIDKEATGGYGTCEPMRELVATFVAQHLTGLRASPGEGNIPRKSVAYGEASAPCDQERNENAYRAEGSDEFGVLIDSNDTDHREFVADLMAKVMQKMDISKEKRQNLSQGEPRVLQDTSWSGLDFFGGTVDPLLSSLRDVGVGDAEMRR
ncbi:MAG: hypothetical protein Q9221_001008 [Calogaya cf. arnoldii]